MERIPTELIYVLVFLGLIVFNFVIQQMARRRQQEAAGQEGQEAQPYEPPAAEDEPLEDLWGRAPAPAPEPVTAPAAVPRPMRSAGVAQAPAQRRPHPVRELLQSRRDLRRAAVLMTVLGPCRAQEPPEQRTSR